MIPVGLAMLGTGARRPTVSFLGWFGPRGLASIVFALLLVEEGGLPNDEIILIVTFVTVGVSVFAHGISAAPLARRYADWLEVHPRPGLASLESEDDPEPREHPLREPPSG
jgi:NhaP-type Na+/H+ or K+/H+ antiporter